MGDNRMKVDGVYKREAHQVKVWVKKPRPGEQVVEEKVHMDKTYYAVLRERKGAWAVSSVQSPFVRAMKGLAALGTKKGDDQ